MPTVPKRMWIAIRRLKRMWIEQHRAARSPINIRYFLENHPETEFHHLPTTPPPKKKHKQTKEIPSEINHPQPLLLPLPSKNEIHKWTPTISATIFPPLSGREVFVAILSDSGFFLDWSDKGIKVPRNVLHLGSWPLGSGVETWCHLFVGGKHPYTLEDERLEPTDHPFRKEKDLPNLHDYVPNLSSGV